ncbi:MAG: hypothetical protein ABIP13_06615 [Tepidiformaceae bacterium]
MRSDWRRRPSRLAGLGAALALLGVALGASVGLAGDQIGPENQSPPRLSNLTPEEAERFARAYAVQQLRLAQPQMAESAPLPGGASSERRRPPAGTSADRPFATIESRFLANGDTSSLGTLARSTRRGAGAWLFVLRAGGVEVPEWETTNAAYEVQVLISDSSGRVLQSGSTLLPEIRPETAAVHR